MAEKVLLPFLPNQARKLPPNFNLPEMPWLKPGKLGKMLFRSLLCSISLAETSCLASPSNFLGGLSASNFLCWAEDKVEDFATPSAMLAGSPKKDDHQLKPLGIFSGDGNSLPLRFNCCLIGFEHFVHPIPNWNDYKCDFFLFKTA